MRTTVNIGDKLLSDAQRMTGIAEKAVLLREGLKALIERESARRLASVSLTPSARLWTRNKRLARVAADLDLAQGGLQA